MHQQNNFDKNFFLKFMFFMILAMLIFHFVSPKKKTEELKQEPTTAQEEKKQAPVEKSVPIFSDEQTKTNISSSYDCFPDCSGVKHTSKMDKKDDYSFTINQTYKNNSSKPIQVSAKITMQNSDETKDNSFVYKGALTYINGDLTYLDEKNESKQYNAASGYLGYTDRYYANIMLIKDGLDVKFTKEDLNQAFNAVQTITVQPGETKTISQPFFAGPKKTEILSAIEKTYGIQHLDLVIDYGTFHFIAKPTGDLLNWLFNLVGNMGMAIIILTIIVRILLFPLAQKSFRSTLAMKKITPQIKAIQNIYKEDKMKQSMEIMKLYKTNKVSPAAGCLPLLLQIPVFFALYRLLLVDFNVAGSSFLWLKDLSLADPTSIFNLFGLLPYSIPSWLPHIGILPILMGFTMWGQQKLQGADMSQMPVMKYMPLLFVVLFSNISAGLILYWTVSNLFAILQMYLLELPNARK